LEVRLPKEEVFNEPEVRNVIKRNPHVGLIMQQFLFVLRGIIPTARYAPACGCSFRAVKNGIIPRIQIPYKNNIPTARYALLAGAAFRAGLLIFSP